MSQAPGPTLRLYLAIVLGSFGLIIGSTWLRAAYPKQSLDAWFGFWGLVDQALQALSRFGDTRLGFYIGVTIIYGLIAFFALGIVLILYEELVKPS